MKIITIIKRTVLGILIVFVAMLVFGLILQKTGYQPKNAPRATEIEQAVTTEIEPSVPVMSNQEQPKKEAVVQAKTEYISQNLLMQKTLREVSIRNAVNKKIGTRAYIEIPGNVLLEVVSLDDITEFYKSFQGKNYNWISIICPDAG